MKPIKALMSKEGDGRILTIYQSENNIFTIKIIQIFICKNCNTIENRIDEVYNNISGMKNALKIAEEHGYIENINVDARDSEINLIID